MPKSPVGVEVDGETEATVLPQAGVRLGAGLLAANQVLPVQENHRQV